MATGLFLCPFDSVQIPGKGVARVSGAARVIPVLPGPSGEKYVWGETVGNYALVKVVGPEAILDLFRAELDFQEIPINAGGDVVSSARVAVRNKLQAMGFLLAEVTAAGFSRAGLLGAVLAQRSVVQENIDATGFQWGATRQTGTLTLEQLDGFLPD